MAIIALVDLNVLFETVEDCAINWVMANCQIQLDIEEKILHLQAGLHISPELRFVITNQISHILEKELAQAITDCANWVAATEGAPNGFEGEVYPPPDDETETETTLTAVVESSPAEKLSDDNPYR
jgi:hypothetical protein